MIAWTLMRTVGPAFEPITLEEAREHIGAGTSPDLDALLAARIVAARERFEEATGRALIDQTWVLRLASFPYEITLPRAPLIAVSSIGYLDTAGQAQVLDPSVYSVYGVGLHRPLGHGKVRPAYGQAWPSTYPVPEAVTITFRAGAADRGTVPEPVRQELLRMVAWLFANRESGAARGLEVAAEGEVPIGASVRLEYGSQWEPEYS